MVRNTERALADLRDQTADTLFSDLETVALAIESSEDNFVPTVRCIQVTQEASGNQIKSSQTTVLCMPSPSRAGNEGTLPCSTVFRKSTSERYNTTKVDVIAGDAIAPAYKYHKRQEYQDLYYSSVAVMLREMQREVNMGPPQLRADFMLIIRPMIIILSFAQQIILIVASWLFSHGEKIDWTQYCEKTLEQHV